MGVLISNVPDCALCCEPGAGVHGVLPDGATASDGYLQVCEHCVERAHKIVLWHEEGNGI
jgi:hypothetical protein